MKGEGLTAVRRRFNASRMCSLASDPARLGVGAIGPITSRSSGPRLAVLAPAAERGR
jgi:hypothetical protein